MEDESKFEEIQTSLLGTTVLKTPRVSRETIISVLQTHTNLIKSMKKDHAKLAFKVSDLETAAKDNNRKVNQLTEDVEAQKKNIVQLFTLSDEFRKEMDELGEQVAELYLLKKSINEQQAFIESLAMRYNKFSTEVNEFMAGVGSTIANVEASCRDTNFQLKELKDYVDHFADNLVLSSGQITVETDAGFTIKPTSLTETLKLARHTLTELETGAEKTGEKIEQITSDLDTKAPDTVLFNVSTLERKVSTIEVHLRKEEEQGIGAIRKACEELSVTVQAMAMEMTEKIDRESVGFIVHEKYEEIVRYLQDALQSSLEDENRFKQKADEIQEMVILLTNSKADRTEIQHMQELMVKSEALLKKVGGQMNLKEKLKDLVTRKDLEALMEMKVDKVDFEIQLQQVLANTKRNRKLTSMAMSGAPQVDDAIDLIKPGTLNKKAVVGSASQPNLGTGGVGGRGRGGPETSQQEALMMQQHALGQYGGEDDGEGYDGTYPGPFEGDGGAQRDQGGAAGGGGNNSVAFSAEFPKIPGAQPPAPRRYPGPGEAPVMAIGRQVSGTTSPTRGGGESGVDSSGLAKAATAKGADFGSYARGKSKNPVTSSSLPNPVAPGQFRSATEAGKAGGQPGERATTPGGRTRGGGQAVPVPAYVDGEKPLTQQQWMALGQDAAAYAQYVQHVGSINASVGAMLTAQMAADPLSLQGAVPDHTSFMQGPVVGGGFNTHSKHLQHKMPGAKPVVEDDVEGKGLMLKGQDGHFYYQDLKQ